eukprot:4950761-Amphidinium_carterae.1
MKFRSIHRLPDTWQGTEHTFLRVRVIANATAPMMRVTTVASGSISPDSSNAGPVLQGRLMGSDHRYPGSR